MSIMKSTILHYNGLVPPNIFFLLYFQKNGNFRRKKKKIKPNKTKVIRANLMDFNFNLDFEDISVLVTFQFW